MSQRYDQALAPAGINLNQYSILRRTDGQGRPLGEIAHAPVSYTHLTLPTIYSV